MAKNCLVKEFKAAVNNDSLEKFGVVEIPLNSGNIPRFNIVGSEPFTLTISGSGVFSDSAFSENYGQTMEAYHDGSIYRCYCWVKGAGDGDIVTVSNKYVMTKITYAGNGNRFKSLPLSYVAQFDELQLSGDDKAYINLNELTKANAVLATVSTLYNNNLSGSLETMVDNMLKAGRTSETVNLYLYYSKFTINGSNAWCQDQETRALPLVVTFNSATSVTATFNSATLATYNNGVWSY